MKTPYISVELSPLGIMAGKRIEFSKDKQKIQFSSFIDTRDFVFFWSKNNNPVEKAVAKILFDRPIHIDEFPTGYGYFGADRYLSKMLERMFRKKLKDTQKEYNKNKNYKFNYV